MPDTTNEPTTHPEVTLGGETYRLDTSYRTMCAIEAALGHSVTKIASDLGGGRVSVKEAALIITIAAGNFGREVKEAKIGEDILRVGLVKVIPPIVELLTTALFGTDAKPPAPRRRRKAAPKPAPPHLAADPTDGP